MCVFALSSHRRCQIARFSALTFGPPRASAILEVKMTAVRKSGIAVLLAAVLLLLSPALICASCFKPASTSAHSCCPEPVQAPPTDCPPTGDCVKAPKAEPVKAERGVSPVLEVALFEVLEPSGIVVHEISRTVFISSSGQFKDRLLTQCQLLI